MRNKITSADKSRMYIQILRDREPAVSPENLQLKQRLSGFIDLIFSIVLTLLFSLPWSYVMQDNVGVSFRPGEQLVVQLIGIAVLVLVIRFYRVSLSLISLLCLATIASFLTKTAILEPLHKAAMSIGTTIYHAVMWSFAATQGDIQRPLEYGILIGILAVVVSFPFIWAKPLPFFLGAVMLFPFFGAAPNIPFSRTHLWALMACLFVVGIVFAGHGKLRFGRKIGFSAPPLILVALLLASAFGLYSALPQDLFREPHLADNIRQLQKRWGAPETVNYYEFSLGQAGYYPMGNKLGGPLSLTHEFFMKVKGPEQPMYLRGSVSDEFTGKAWVGQLMDPNYIFDNEATSGKQAEVFGYPSAVRGGDKTLERFFVRDMLTITPQLFPIQVIFNGGRPKQILDNGTEHIYYFNNGGQIYSGTELGPEGYRVDGWIPKALSNDELDNLLRTYTSEGTIKLRGTEPTGQYRNILMSSDPELYRIVYESDNSTPEAKLNTLIALRNYLSTHYKYNIQVGYPDDNVDFLSWFIMQKEGYCVYFATAMTLLAREAGIDARYVEGFVVPGVDPEYYNDHGYERQVLGDSAHAWTEVYFEGLGWYPIDATPASDLDGLRRDQNEQGSRQPNKETSPSTTPPTTPPQTPPPTPPTSRPSPTPPQNAPDNPPPQPPQAPPISPQVIRLLILLAAVLLLLLLLVLFLLYCKKRYQRRHDRSRLLGAYPYGLNILADRVWEDMKHMCELAGVQFSDNQTLMQRFFRIEQEFNELGRGQGQRTFRILEKLFYEEKDLNQQDMAEILNTYDILEEGLKTRMKRSKWLFKRWLFPGRTARLARPL